MAELVFFRGFQGFFAAFSLMFLVCAGPASATQRDTLVYANYTDIADWDPASAFSTESILLHNVYETLVRYVPDDSAAGFRLEPVLAESWSVSADRLTWRFKLRDGVAFHDGTALTAEAARAALQRTIDLKKGAAYIWDSVRSITAEGPLDLVIETTNPQPIDLIASAQYGAFIYSPQSAQGGADWFRKGQDGGTGPYRVSKWKSGQFVLLDQHQDYWGGWRDGQFKRALIRITQEASTQSRLITTGKADFISLAAIPVVEKLRERDDVVVALAPSWKNSQFLLNTQKYPTSDANFRKAIVHAWDYNAVVEGIYQGAATVSKGVIPANMWGHDTKLASPALDLALARKHLAASAVPESERKIKITYISGSEAYASAALMLQANLEKIGIQAELFPGEWGRIWGQARNIDTAPNMISMTWWPTYPTPGDWLVGLFKTEASPLFNLSHYKNPAYDTLVADGLALSGVDKTAAIGKFQAAQRLLIEDAVAVFYADVFDRQIYRADLNVPAKNPAYDAVFFYNVTQK